MYFWAKKHKPVKYSLKAFSKAALSNFTGSCISFVDKLILKNSYQRIKNELFFYYFEKFMHYNIK